jgi:hypothetical protein
VTGLLPNALIANLVLHVVDSITVSKKDNIESSSSFTYSTFKFLQSMFADCAKKRGDM